MPMVGGAVLFFLIVFALYVRSVPPKVPTPKTSPAPGMDAQRILEQAMKDGNIKFDTSGEGVEVPPMEEAPAPPESETEPNEEPVEL